MSTLKTTNLQNASAASPAFVLAADGSATANLSSLNGGPIAGTRNRIINGDMRIDQRNAGASVTFTNSVGYALDRHRTVALGASLGFSVQRSTTAPTGFSNSLLATVTSAKSPASTDQARINQYIEGFNTADLGWGTADAQAVTLSFWVRSSVTGTYCVAISNADTATRSYIATYTVLAADTWERKSVTISGDTSGTWTTSSLIGIGISFALGCGSSYNAAAASTWYGAEYQQTASQVSWIATNGATFYITGVQLEPGSVATPFERRSYSTELILCQRYFQAIGSSNAIVGISAGSFTGSTEVQACTPFLCTMRAAPTATTTGAFIARGGTLAISATLSSISSGTNSTSLNWTVSGGNTGNGVYLRTDTGGGFILFNSEL
jgi:hypothetical protein